MTPQPQGFDKLLQGLQASVQQVLQMVQQQSAENQQLAQQIIAEMTRPKTRKAVRGQDGRIQGSEEVPT